MSDFNTSKVDGDTVGASEWNQLADVDNLVINSGQTPSSSNLDQLAIASARYSSGGQFFTDSGTANAYVLSPVSPFKSPVSSGAGEGYFTGMIIRFRAGNANSGASTVNVNGAGVKNLLKEDGSALTAGDITTNNDVSFRYDGTAFVRFLGNATTTTQGITFLNSPITIANNATTPNTKIDFLAGNAQLNDGSGQVLLSSALTKILQSTGAWTAGNDANGLFSGARANNTWYYAFAIQNTTTNAVDAGFDSSPTGANVPSGWKITKLIHCFRTNASGNILAGTYFKDKTFSYNSSILEETATNATVAGNLTLSYVPPVPAYAINLAYANNNAANAYAYYVAGTSGSNIYWETSKLNAGYGRANGVIPTNNAVIYRSYGGDQARTCELYTNGFKLID